MAPPNGYSKWLLPMATPNGYSAPGLAHRAGHPRLADRYVSAALPDLPAARAGWVSTLLLESLRDAVQPPGSRTETATSRARGLTRGSNTPAARGQCVRCLWIRSGWIRAGWITEVLLEIVTPPGPKEAALTMSLRSPSATRQPTCSSRVGQRDAIVNGHFARLGGVSINIK